MTYYEELNELEKEYAFSLSPYEIVQTFPIAKRVIPHQIKRLKKEKDELIEEIKAKLTYLKYYEPYELLRLFWRAYIKHTDIKRLLDCERKLKNLYQMLAIAKEVYPTSGGNVFFKDSLERARQYPIASLLSDHELKRVGRNYKTLCPLHNERSPSFYIYPDQNTFYCFGCNTGGDAIKLFMLLNSCSFTEAVRRLSWR